jgi:hypothetical protein
VQTNMVPRQNPETAARVINDATFILHAETSVLSSLNEVGARIWELTDGARSVGQIAAAIESEYDIDLAKAEADVSAFMDELVKQGLILTT